MPSKTSKKQGAVTLPSIPKELIDQMVSGPMDPKGKHPLTSDLFQQTLAELINIKHLLVKLAERIDWLVFETRWAAFFPSCTGRPASSPLLIAGLLYLLHTFACSDEELIWTWLENP